MYLYLFPTPWTYRTSKGRQVLTTCYYQHILMGVTQPHTAVAPMCCVTHVKEPSALIKKRRGSPRCSWLWLLYALYKVSILLLFNIIQTPQAIYVKR